MGLPADFMSRLAATHGKPSEFSELVFGTPLHAGQEKYARLALADVNFLLPGNSWGKTEFIARYVTYLSWFKEGPYRPLKFREWMAQEYKALVASYAYSIAEESFDRLDNHYRNREEFQALCSRQPVSAPTGVIYLKNGAVIEWGSLYEKGKGVEAARRRVIFIDEAGHIPDLSETFDSILFPRTMGVGGRIHLLGTPKPHSDPYLLEVYEKGKGGGDDFYYSQDGSVLENEFWPEREKRRVLANPRMVTDWRPCEEGGCDFGLCLVRDGERKHPVLTPIGKQVLLGAFVGGSGPFFNRFHITRMFGEWSDEWGTPEWLGDSFAIPPREGRLYMGAFDLAGNKLKQKKKRGSDPTVGIVIDYTERPWKVVRFDFVRGGEADWEDKYTLMSQVYRDYRLPYLIIDATGNVDSVQEALQNRGVEVEGVHFGGASNKKLDMLRNLQLATEMQWGGTRGLIRSPLIPQMKHELDHYRLPDDDIQQDTVMTLAMVASETMANEVPEYVSGEVF